MVKTTSGLEPLSFFNDNDDSDNDDEEEEGYDQRNENQ